MKFCTFKKWVFLSLLSTIMLAHAGSGIGGGVLHSMINWCDEASVMVSEARIEALDRLHRGNNRIDALKIFYQGLVEAAGTSEDSDVDVGTSLTYKAIGRGIRLAQILEIPSIINGAPVSSELKGEKEILGLLSLMDWFSLHIEKVASRVDRVYYLPYNHRRDQIKFSTAVLEQELIQISVSQLKELNKRFIGLKTDKSSFYSRVPVEQYLKSLSYLAQEVAIDLEGTLLSEVLGCQAKKLVKLSRRIQTFLDGRSDNEEDVYFLNKFVLETNIIVNQIINRSCVR